MRPVGRYATYGFAAGIVVGFILFAVYREQGRWAEQLSAYTMLSFAVAGAALWGWGLRRGSGIVAASAIVAGLLLAALTVPSETEWQARRIAERARIEQERVAAAAREKAAKAKAAAEARAEQKRQAREARQEARARANEEARCHESLDCSGNALVGEAALRCVREVERFAQYQAEWTDGTLQTKFYMFRWQEPGSVITMLGDRVRFQNGFGAWQNMVYECDMDVRSKAVLDVRVHPGRL